MTLYKSGSLSITEVENTEIIPSVPRVCFATTDDEDIRLVIVVHGVPDASVHWQVDVRETASPGGCDAHDSCDVFNDRLVATT